MKQIKLVLKRILIIYVIIFVTLSSMSSCLARGYDDKCGEFLVEKTKEFIQKYQSVSYYLAEQEVTWTGGELGKGDLYVCCTSGVKYMYELYLGVNLYDLGYSALSDDNLNPPSQYWDKIPVSEAKPGDILVRAGHVEMATTAGAGEHANFGSTSAHACNVHSYGDTFTTAIRLKNTVQVNPTGSVALDEIEDENGFIYTGVAKIEGYKGSVPFRKGILKSLLQILDYLIGILTYATRAVIVGWTAIFERFFMDGLVNAITGVTNKRDDEWQQDPNSIDDIDKEAEEKAKADNETKEQPQASGDENDANDYVSEGMQRIADIGGNVQLTTSSEADVTVENIVYNKIPILDANFFNFESAGGAVVDENGIVYIIKENVAIWYYVFRTMAILIMLIILLYLGIKMAITTVAEKKAVYKQMLVSWIAGFILVFTIHYIMYFIISVNETFISWIIPKYEDGTELSLYESVRTKAYSLKATTGTAGLVMYAVLVYYSIRFLLLYFKRYLTIMILAIISPFVSVSYAVQKINKKRKRRRDVWKLDERFYVFSNTTINACTDIYNFCENGIRLK